MRHNELNNGNMDDHSLERGNAHDTGLVPVGAESLGGYTSGAISMHRPYGEAEDGVDLKGLMNMVRRRLKPILGILFTVMVIGAFITWRTPRVYQASTTILVDVAAKGAASDPMTALLGGSSTSSLETEIAIVLSKPVLSAALTRIPKSDVALVEKFSGNEDGKTDAVDLLAPGAVSALTTGDASVITVTALTYDPKASARLSQAVAEAYLKYDLEQKQRKTGGGAQYLRGQVKRVKGELDKARRDLLEFKKKNNIVDPDEETKARIDQLTRVTTDLRTAEVERLAGISQLNVLQNEANRLEPNIVSGLTTTPSAVAEALQNKLTNLEISRIDALQEYTARSPEVRNIEAQIAIMEKRVTSEARRQLGTSTTSPNPLRTQVLQTMTQTLGQTRALEARIRALQIAEKDVKTELAKLPSVSYRLSQLATEVSIQQTAYTTLSQNSQNLDVTTSSTVSDANVLSPAEPPRQATYPRKLKNMAVITILGLMLALAWASVVERLDNKVHSEEEAEALVRRPVLAQVPALKELPQQSLLTTLGKPTPLLESFRMLRTNLSFSALDKAIRSVAITSSLPGEGKSTSAMNLAIVSAMSGKQVILVDCDLRRPTLHKLLGVANRVGFTTLVSGAAQLEEALSATKIPNLRVVTSGPLPPDPTELLNSKAARACLNEIAEQAELVVIDCPPALAMADAQIVASVSDAVILVVSSKDAGKQEIARTSDLLFQTGARFLGVILTKITSDFTGYQKYEYYGEYLKGQDNGNGANGDGGVTEDSPAQLTTKDS